MGVEVSTHTFPNAARQLSAWESFDNAKEVANAVHEIKNIELYGRVLELNSGIMDLVEENRKLHAENNELKEKFWLREKMVFKEPLYFQDGDEPPFCPLCWEKHSIAIHLVQQWNDRGQIRWRCSACKDGFTVGL